jgi:hypothetical protein
MLCGTANAALIEVWQSDSDLLSIFDADSLIASGDATYSDLYNGLIDFDDLGDGTRGFNSLDIPWLGGVDTNFAARVTGSIDMVAAAVWDIFVDHDDGVRVTVNGVKIIEFPGITDNYLSYSPASLGAGTNLVEVIFFEHRGGASLELYAGVPGTVGPDDLIGLRTVPEPGTLALLGIGLFGLGLSRRKKTV